MMLVSGRGSRAWSIARHLEEHVSIQESDMPNIYDTPGAHTINGSNIED